MKYARWELERRFVLESLPAEAGPPTRMADHYLQGLRLRLRQMKGPDGEQFKLGQKHRPDGARLHARQMTTLYLTAAEHADLEARLALGVSPLVKHRHRWQNAGHAWVVDRFAAPHAGLIVAEVEADASDLADIAPPPGTVREVTDDPLTDGNVLAALVGGVGPGAATLRPLQPHDLPALAGWLSDPRLLADYGGRDQPLDLALTRAKYLPRILHHDPVLPLRIDAADGPAGFLQLYVTDPAEYALEPGPRAFGTDLFIAPDRQGEGLGTAALLAVQQVVRLAGGGRLAVDPRADNTRAMAAYRSAGFASAGRLTRREHHEGSWHPLDAFVWSTD
ncbi:MAG: aminoglycoside 6'-N-acetyltransferase [Myxococcota bacterium]